MENIVEVRFKFDRRIYYVNPNKIPLYINKHVIVEAEKGADMGRVSSYNIEPNKINFKKFKVYKIIREANKNDIENLKRIREKEEKAKVQFLESLKNYPFEMKLVESEFQFDGNKLTFYFMAEKRIDFRNLVKDLAKIYRTRIELRQINERQQMKYLGGIGRCGKELCCKKMNLYSSKANVKMAKLQNVTTTSTKITGLCGKILCCLAFEQKFYEGKAENFPNIGDEVTYKNKKMMVARNNYLKSTLELIDRDEIKYSVSLKKYLSLLTKKVNSNHSYKGKNYDEKNSNFSPGKNKR